MTSGSMSALMALLVVALLAGSAIAETAGRESRYMRRLAQSIDLPLNSSFFAVPVGKNAPQQVRRRDFLSKPPLPSIHAR